MKTVELESLVGTHLLSGVDRLLPQGLDRVYAAQVLNIMLDGIGYCFAEDPEDGYRSCLGDVFVLDKRRLKSKFGPIMVRAKMRDGDDTYVLDFYDVENNLLVLSVGTENWDDYYPYFIAEFDPRNLSVNKPL